MDGKTVMRSDEGRKIVLGFAVILLLLFAWVEKADNEAERAARTMQVLHWIMSFLGLAASMVAFGMGASTIGVALLAVAAVGGALGAAGDGLAWLSGLTNFADGGGSGFAGIGVSGDADGDGWPDDLDGDGDVDGGVRLGFGDMKFGGDDAKDEAE